MADFELVSTVTDPAETYDLVSLADVKEEIGITGGGDDAILKKWISRASRAVSQYCNRVFVQETVSDEFWPARDPFPRIMRGGVDPLQLSRYPIVSVTSVVENHATLADQTDFRVKPDKGQLIRLNEAAYPKIWPAFPIAVVYVAGFEDIPDDVVDATIRMVKARRDARGRDPFLKQRTIPGVIEQQWWVATGTETGNMPPDVVDLLDNHRVPVIG